MKLIFLGPPGAGKGTQAELVSKELGIAHISTGDLLRAQLRQGTPVGLAAQVYMDRGELVPDDVILAMVKERIAQADCSNGFLLDGFPRTIAQAQALDALVAVDMAINLRVPESRLMERICGRRMCPDCGAAVHVCSYGGALCPKCSGELYQRDDDTPPTVRNRLEVYRHKTQPLIDHYAQKGLLRNIDGGQSVEDTFGDIRAALEAASHG